MDNAAFFDVFAPYYEQQYAEVNPRAAVRLWHRRLEGKRLLPAKDARNIHSHNLIDVGCGPGWHLCEWMAAGYRVTGLDVSPAMLRIAAANASRDSCPEQPALFCADVREPDTFSTLANRFDIAVAHFNFLNLLSLDEVPLAFTSIATILTSTGIFVTDLLVDATAAAREAPDGSSRGWGLPARRVRQWETATGILQETYWLHSFASLRGLALDCGLAMVDGANLEGAEVEESLSLNETEPTKLWLAFQKTPDVASDEC